MKQIAIIQGHPDPGGQHYCHALAEAYATGAREAGHRLESIDVSRMDFPLLRSRADGESEPVPDAIRAAQEALTRANHVALFFPIWNGTGPALLRGFLEQTCQASFVFPDRKVGERLGFTSHFTQRKVLAGRSARVVATMQMPAWLYRWFFRPHPERNSLSVAGLRPVRETLIGNVEAEDGQRRATWLARMRVLGREAL
jgi:putative NADPH-quinone reductase